MAHWRSPRTMLLVKIFFIFSYSLFLPFSKEMFLVVEIGFSDELKSRKVLKKIFRICRLHHFWTKFNNKKKKKTSLQKEFEQGPFGYYEFLGICKRLQEKQHKNVLADLASYLWKLHSVSLWYLENEIIWTSKRSVGAPCWSHNDVTFLSDPSPIIVYPCHWLTH